jgi:hypothetical protein
MLPLHVSRLRHVPPSLGLSSVSNWLPEAGRCNSRQQATEDVRADERY